MATTTLVQTWPTLMDLLQQTTRQWHCYIANKDDAITIGQNIILSGHIGPDQGEDEEYDYPMTPDDESELVRILYEAMCDFSDPFEERNGKTSFQVERLKMVSDLQMEVIAWDVLVSADQQTDIMTLKLFGLDADTEPEIRWPSKERTVDTTDSGSATATSSTRSSVPLVLVSGLSSTLVEFVIPTQVTSSCPSLTASFPGVQEPRLQSARS